MFLLTERELNLQKQSWDLAGSEPKTGTSKPLGPLAEEGKKNYISSIAWLPRNTCAFSLLVLCNFLVVKSTLFINSE